MIRFSKLQKFALLITLLLIITLSGNAQISITSADMPEPGQSMPISRKAPLGDAIIGYELPGENIQWDFSSITKTEQQVVEYISPTSTDIQYICIAIFNNPLDADHNSTVAKPGEGMSDPMGSIQVTDVFDFFKNDSSLFTNVGRSSNVNTVPTCIRNIPVDTLYVFPLEFGTTFTSNSAFEIDIPTIGYYGQTLNRSSVADAWGTITTPYGTFEALRIVSTLEFVDTIYYESMGFGAKFPHTETHYTWLSNDMKFPVFSIEDKGQNFGGTIAFWPDTLDETGIIQHTEANEFTCVPNPADDYLNITLSGTFSFPYMIDIYNITGVKIDQIELHNPSITISTANYTPGVYFLKSTNGKQRQLLYIIR